MAIKRVRIGSAAIVRMDNGRMIAYAYGEEMGLDPLPALKKGLGPRETFVAAVPITVESGAVKYWKTLIAFGEAVEMNPPVENFLADVALGVYQAMKKTKKKR